MKTGAVLLCHLETITDRRDHVRIVHVPANSAGVASVYMSVATRPALGYAAPNLRRGGNSDDHCGGFGRPGEMRNHGLTPRNDGRGSKHAALPVDLDHLGGVRSGSRCAEADLQQARSADWRRRQDARRKIAIKEANRKSVSDGVGSTCSRDHLCSPGRLSTARLSYGVVTGWPIVAGL